MPLRLMSSLTNKRWASREQLSPLLNAVPEVSHKFTDAGKFGKPSGTAVHYMHFDPWVASPTATFAAFAAHARPVSSSSQDVHETPLLDIEHREPVVSLAGPRQFQASSNGSANHQLIRYRLWVCDQLLQLMKCSHQDLSLSETISERGEAGLADRVILA